MRHWILSLFFTEPETKDDDSDFDDMFRNRFIMDPEETARIKPGIEKKLTKIPDIPNSSTLIVCKLKLVVCLLYAKC